jgi:hypothetical protein
MRTYLWASPGTGAASTSSADEFDPVYGLPRRAVDEWLARNPQLQREYTMEEWLARNPPLRQEVDEAQRRRLLALGARYP